MEKKDNQRRWRIELTEEQLRVAIEAIEDWHRFISGQCEMDYATSYIDNSNAPNPKPVPVITGAVLYP